MTAYLVRGGFDRTKLALGVPLPVVSDPMRSPLGDERPTAVAVDGATVFLWAAKDGSTAGLVAGGTASNAHEGILPPKSAGATHHYNRVQFDVICDRLRAVPLPSAALQSFAPFVAPAAEIAHSVIADTRDRIVAVSPEAEALLNLMLIEQSNGGL